MSHAPTHRARLELAQQDEELQFLFDTRTHPLVSEKMFGAKPESYEQHLQYLGRVQGKSRWIYIAYNHLGEMFGYSQIYGVSDTHAEVGFAIHPKFQGMGLGRALVLATVERVLADFPGRRPFLLVQTTNPRAIHIYEQTGFHKKGVEGLQLRMEYESR